MLGAGRSDGAPAGAPASRGRGNSERRRGIISDHMVSYYAFMDIAEIHCMVSGKVQGVTYRDFVAKHARHLALVGYVRNLPDSKVEIVAQGLPDSLEKFLEYARRGPLFARVSNIEVEWREPRERYQSFEVVF